MKYSLDSNICIRYINGRAPKLREKIPSIPATEIVVCSIVRAELFYGSAKSQTPQKSLEKQLRFLRAFATLPFNDEAAREFAAIRADLESRGLPIGAYDMIIAAIAIANNLIVVTHNTREFSRITGLQIEDWEV